MPANAIGFICGGNINTRRICVQDTGNAFSVIQATNATAEPIGISSGETEFPPGNLQDTNGYAGQTGYTGMRLFQLGEETTVEAGAVFNAGNVMSDTNGRAIAATTGNWSVGFALQAATASLQFVTVKIDPGYVR